MHARKENCCGSALPSASEQASDGDLGTPCDVPEAGTFMSVLYPATPPTPRNARFIRGIGFASSKIPSQRESTLADSAPASVEAPGGQVASRAVRALRNASLRVAAGLE